MSHKLPAMQFYPGDWLKDPNLRRCSHAARGVWIDMLCLMHECEQRGRLATAGVPWTDAEIVRAVGGDPAVTAEALAELGRAGVYSRDDGAVVCRRMLRDDSMRADRAHAGRRGAGARWQNDGKPMASSMANAWQTDGKGHGKPMAKVMAKHGSSSSSSSSKTTPTPPASADADPEVVVGGNTQTPERTPAHDAIAALGVGAKAVNELGDALANATAGTTLMPAQVIARVKDDARLPTDAGPGLWVNALRAGMGQAVRKMLAERQAKTTDRDRAIAQCKQDREALDALPADDRQACLDYARRRLSGMDARDEARLVAEAALALRVHGLVAIRRRLT